MKSIQAKIMCLTLGGVLLSTFVIMLVSITNYSGILKNNSEEIMNLLCTKKRQEMDEQLMSIEQSVNTIYHFALSQLEQMEEDDFWEDEKALEQYIQKVREVSLNAVENTEGAIAVYYRFNPEKITLNEGLFLVSDEKGNFTDFEMTDILKYDKEDVEHVGWYYIPLENERATWISPYYNKNTGVYMLSYVIPIYLNDMTVGIIGMDIQMDGLYKNVDSVTVYDSGYAFLMDQAGNILYHKEFPDGLKKAEYTKEQMTLYTAILEGRRTGESTDYMWNGEQKRMVAQKLQNNMLFVVCVPEKEIVEPQQKMIVYSLTMAGVILVVIMTITIQLTKVITQPLKQLTEAARKIANVDLDVSIECKSKDEVGILAQSFRQTAEHLRHYIDYINKLAYTDVLTGFKNKTAYEECIAHLDEEISKGTASFAVAVMDINYLKQVNDSLGHEQGDLLIQNIASIMKKVWKTEHMYRIGGDEFVVIMEGEDSRLHQSRIGAFEEEMIKANREQNHREFPIQVAVGLTEFIKDKDTSFLEVFRRADALMYEDKVKKKNEKDNCICTKM